MSFRPHLLSGLATVAIVASALPAPAYAQQAIAFDIPAQDLGGALRAFALASGVQVIFDGDALRGKRSQALKGNYAAGEALSALLRGSGMSAQRNAEGVFVVTRATADAAPDNDAGPRANEIVVTAQKFEQRIQDVPMAITAIDNKSLQAQKIETGADIMRAVPNMTFTKTNFSGYDISIRGIGTKAISATTDPAVAVSYNNTGLIHNRLFEQEFFDIDRIEVLRGPQGTLYGRNATGGVVNLITAKPKLGRFEGEIKAEVGNYKSRRMVGMLNVPIIDDVLGVRVAGSMTSREGYDYNLATQNRVNGRDLYSLRTTVGFEPASWLRANFVWEHFNENDNRSRTGKQLCHRDEGPLTVGNQSTDPLAGNPASVSRRALFSQGCKPGSLYEDDAFGTVNGLALPFVFFPIVYGGNCGPTCSSLGALGYDDDGLPHTFVQEIDPYGGRMQSRNLREIESVRDPLYRARSDIYQMNLEFDLGQNFTFTSQSAWNKDSVYSIQDYNRFNTDPVFVDTSLLDYGDGISGNYRNLIPGGVYCDPQLGCSSRIAGLDQSSANSKQFSQEIRLQSHFDGPINFSFGGNFTKFKTQDDYYVFNNLLTLLALTRPFNKGSVDGNVDITQCYASGFAGGLLGGIAGDGPVPVDDPTSSCPYIDPNPVESINGQGHNYFRSSNPYRLKSWAAFGEVYWNLNDSLKLTAGLRYTDDRKTFTPVPSQLLLAYGFTSAGTTPIGYPEKPDIRQHWGKFTGRLGLDWKAQLPFTDETLLYGFYSRGYKAGGANPPSPGFATYEEMLEQARNAGPLWAGFAQLQDERGNLPPVYLTAVEYGPTFKPEYVNAFELGMKNTLLGGALMLNATAFYYDYTGYQVSQIRDRTAVNENFDTKMWGLEFETMFAPTERLRLNANVGYMRTRINNGQYSIDTMNRTQGNPNYVVAKPWVQLPSNCVVPVSVAEYFLASRPNNITSFWGMCGGFLNPAYNEVIDPATGQGYDVRNYPELNGGAGLKADIGGNELPNSPRVTANFGAEYEIPFGTEWTATIRGDAYWQGKSWARVYNLNPYDRLKSWTNFNLSLRINGPEDLTIEAYVKNVFNSTPITGAFLNSDDSGLTTNVFTLDPRIIGFSIAKKF